MSNTPINYEEIRRRAEKRVKKRAEFIQHVAIYLIVNVFLWIFFGFISLFAGTRYVLIPAILSTLGWGMAVAIHAATVFAETNLIDNMREREIQREMQREMNRLGISDPAELYDKPKRDAAVRLSDDGELIYEDEKVSKRSNGSR
jgi:heme O synthase-like polyprenyltransferase